MLNIKNSHQRRWQIPRPLCSGHEIYVADTKLRLKLSRGNNSGSIKARHPFRVVLGWAYRGLTGGFLLLQNFSVAISVSPHVCFILVLILIYELGIFHANQTTKCLRNKAELRRGLVDRKLVEAPQ